MNILVTGANGQLGNCLRNAVRNSNDRYIFTDIADDERTRRLDITDRDAVMNSSTQPLYVTSPMLLKRTGVPSYTYPPTTCSAKSRTTSPAARIRRAHPQAYTE